MPSLIYNLIFRYFESWKKNVRYNLLAKESENERKKTKDRMLKFLEAAAINEHQQLKEDNLPVTSRSNKVTSARNTLRRSKSFESKKYFLKIN